MDRGAWQAMVRVVTKSQTGLKRFNGTRELSCCGSRAPQPSQELWFMGLVASQCVDSSWTSGGTCVSCVGGRIPVLCTTREVPFFAVLMDVSK